MMVPSRPYQKPLASSRRRGMALRVERLEERALLSFSPPVNYELGLNPAGMATADLNGDGYPDIVAANANFLRFGGIDNGQVSVSLNNGNGTFAAPIYMDSGPTTSSVAIADFDLDGYLDIAAINSNRVLQPFGPSSVTVLFSDGTGTAWARRFDDIEIGYDGSSIAAGDMNSDGFTDLLVTNADTREGQPGSVMMIVNNGDGTFAAPTIILSGQGPDRLGPGWVVVGDYNGDTLLDLAVSCGRGNAVRILLGFGDGTFATPIDHEIHVGPNTMRSGDFNGDGILDLVASHGRLLAQGDPQVSVLIGNGDGTFQPYIRHDIGTNPLGVITGDFNGDGLSDIAVSNPPISLFGSSRTIQVALGNGDGTFVNLAPITTGEAPFGLAVDDFDLMNGFDLAVTNADPAPPFGGIPGTMSILLNDGGSWDAPGPNLGAGLAFLSILEEDFTIHAGIGETGDLRPTVSARSESAGTASGEARRIDLVFMGEPRAAQSTLPTAGLTEFELPISLN